MYASSYGDIALCGGGKACQAAVSDRMSVGSKGLHALRVTVDLANRERDVPSAPSRRLSLRNDEAPAA